MGRFSGRLFAVLLPWLFPVVCLPECRAGFTTVLSETWEGESVGDTADELVSWQREPGYGDGGSELATIATDAGWPFGKFLLMNPPNPPPWGDASSMGLRTKGSYTALAPGSVLSVRSKVLLGPSDGDGGGVVGFARSGAPLWGYGLAVSRVADGQGGYHAALEVHEFNGALTGVGYGYQVVAIDPTDAGDVHTYELHARFGGASTFFEVYWDGTRVPALDAEDLSPVAFAGSAVFSLAANGGQKVYFDDFLAAQDLTLVDVPDDGGGSRRPDGEPGLTVTPCPFTSTARIWYRLSGAAPVRLEIYDARGGQVRSIDLGLVAGGLHAVDWNGIDARGRSTPAGVYFAWLRAGGQIWTRPVVRNR